MFVPWRRHDPVLEKPEKDRTVQNNRIKQPLIGLVLVYPISKQ